MQRAAESDRNMQLMLRSMANGVISERDRLWEYSTGEVYQEMSLFLQESETRKKEFEKLHKK